MVLGFGVLSVTHPTRLETRTKESNMGASYWVAKPKSVMNVKAGSVSLHGIRGFGCGAPWSRPDCIVSGAEIERACWDPKDGELCLNRMKPEETLVEVRRGSDVQIDLQIWVKGRKTNRTI